MSEVLVRYFGGPLDGFEQPVPRWGFDWWVGAAPWGHFIHGSRIHLYESWRPFADDDATVDVFWAGILTDDGEPYPIDDSGYDGWLSTEDQYHPTDTEGRP